MADCNYHLFIHKISPETTGHDCRQYLSRFGEIVKFRCNAKKRKVARYAFVKYKNAENASSVLENQKHTISPLKTFYVKACDSWNQPKKPARSEQSKGHKSNQSEFEEKADAQSANNTKIENVGANLLNLNEDCLMAILAYLPLEDQVSLARSHIDLEAIFKSYAKIHYKKIDSDKFLTMSLVNMRETFLLAGEFFERFDFGPSLLNKNIKRICSFVQSNCPNLRRIFMYWSRERVLSLRTILTNKSHLTHLTFIKTFADSWIHAMKNTPTLEHLAIVRCDYFTGRLLHLLPQLKSLCLAGCKDLNSTHLLKALSAMPDLILLDITGTGNRHKSVIDALPMKNKNLEILRMSWIDDSFDSVAKLQNLRSLGLYCDILCDAPRSSTLKFIVDNFAEKLHYLHIKSRKIVNLELCEFIPKLVALKRLHIPCNSIMDQNSLIVFGHLENLVEIVLYSISSLTNEILLELIRNCPLLKWINLFCAYSISNEFVKNLLPILKQGKRTNGRLIIWICGTQIWNKGLSKEYETAETKALVEFIFGGIYTLKLYDDFFDDFKKIYNGMEEELTGLFFHEFVESNSNDYLYIGDPDSDNDDSDEDMLEDA